VAEATAREIQVKLAPRAAGRPAEAGEGPGRRVRSLPEGTSPSQPPHRGRHARQHRALRDHAPPLPRLRAGLRRHRGRERDAGLPRDGAGEGDVPPGPAPPRARRSSWTPGSGMRTLPSRTSASTTGTGRASTGTSAARPS
jgi:hypothetical protein